MEGGYYNGEKRHENNSGCGNFKFRKDHIYQKSDLPLYKYSYVPWLRVYDLGSPKIPVGNFSGRDAGAGSIKGAAGNEGDLGGIG
jgi:hypothetical protein